MLCENHWSWHQARKQQPSNTNCRLSSIEKHCNHFSDNILPILMFHLWCSIWTLTSQSPFMSASHRNTQCQYISSAKNERRDKGMNRKELWWRGKIPYWCPIWKAPNFGGWWWIKGCNGGGHCCWRASQACSLALIETCCGSCCILHVCPAASCSLCAHQSCESKCTCCCLQTPKPPPVPMYIRLRKMNFILAFKTTEWGGAPGKKKTIWWTVAQAGIVESLCHTLLSLGFKWHTSGSVGHPLKCCMTWKFIQDLVCPPDLVTYLLEKKRKKRHLLL